MVPLPGCADSAHPRRHDYRPAGGTRGPAHVQDGALHCGMRIRHNFTLSRNLRHCRCNDNRADRRAFVSVNPYDGDRNVGELTGNAVLKPNSKSSVVLIRTDDLVDCDEARVDLRFGGPEFPHRLTERIAAVRTPNVDCSSRFR